MKKLTINYQENWDCNGTHTTQNVKLSKEIIEKFNYYLADLIKPIKEKSIISNSEMDLLIFAQPLKSYNSCIGLTRLRLLKIFLDDEGYDTTRLLTDRNTMIIEENKGNKNMKKNNKIKNENLIDFISDLWEIEIQPYDENKKYDFELIKLN